MDSNSLDGGGSTYVAQLHQVFSGCDSSGTGYLGRPELVELCAQLHLDEQSNLVLGHLLGDDPEAKVDFHEFKEKFVYLLAHSVQGNETHEESSHEEDEGKEEDDGSIRCVAHDREISPKYIWGSKKYGRRSRPDGETNDTSEDFALSDASDSEVFVDKSQIERERRTEPSSADVDSTVTTLTTVRPRASSFGGKTGAKRRRRMRSSEDTKYFASVDVTVNPNTEEDENEEEYLRSIWLKLGVGTDGFLDQEGLTQVCEHIGMEKMSEEVVAQLFEKLDVDQDGRIHFDEFLHLFRTGEATTTTANHSPISGHKKLDDSSERQASSSSSVNGVTSNGGNPNESGIFCSIDLYNTGYAEPEAIWELWDSLGITEGYTILKELGFCTDSQVCLLDLTNVLEDILQNPSDPELSHVAFLTYNYDVKFLRRTVHQLKLERDYLLMDVADANSRATLIAQEVDENQAKLEQKSQETIVNLGRKYQEQMRRLKEELDSEQEQWNEQILKLKRELQEEVNNRQEVEVRHREQLSEMEKEMMEVSKEKQNLEKKLFEVERDNERKLEAMCQLRPKDEEKSYEGRCQDLAVELEMYKSINKQLQDKNDELNAKVEELETQLPSKLNLEVGMCDDGDAEEELDEEGVLLSLPKGHRRTGSCLSDYIKTTPTVDRRGSGNATVTSPPDAEQPSGTHNYNQETDMKMNDASDAVLSSSFLVTNDWSGDEEYLTYLPKTASRTVLLPNEMQDSVTKLQVKQVFSVLKRRFIENYLEEMEDTTIAICGDKGATTTCDVHLCPSAHEEMNLYHLCQVVSNMDDLETESPERLVKDRTGPSSSMTMDESLLWSPVLETSAKISSDSGFHDNTTTPLKTHCGLSPTVENCSIEEWEQENHVCTRPLAEEAEQCHLDHGNRADEVQSMFHDEMVSIQQQWQTELEGEREKWMELVLSMESHQKELQEKLIEEEVSHKTDVLHSEVFWREQVEQERLEQEQERADLVDKILGLEFQLESTRKKQRPRVTRDFAFDDDVVVGCCGDSSVRRSKSWREYSTTSQRSQQSTESTRRCLSGKLLRDKWAMKPENTSLNSPSLDTDSLEERSCGEELSKAHKCCKHKVSCCGQLNLYKSQLRSTNKEIESLKKEIQRLQREFLTQGTSLRLATSSDRPNCVIDVEMLHTINQHVKQQEQRCRQLEATMATKTLQAEKELTDTRHAYDEELRRVTQLLSKTKGLLKEYTSKAREQSEKLLQSDLLVKELYIENAQLMKTVQMLEEKNEISKKTNFNLQQKYLALNKLLTEMCRVPPPTSSSSA